jgi:hypothetical protein
MQLLKPFTMGGDMTLVIELGSMSSSHTEVMT